MTERKETNPKDAIGVRKAPASVVPRGVVAEIGLGMLEGACKYGRHNYRVAVVRASVYYDALQRHLDAWWEGEDIDPESMLNHITKLLSCGSVLRDAMLNDMWTDDRPPPMRDPDWQRKLNAKAGEILDRYPEPKAAYVRGDTALHGSPEGLQRVEGFAGSDGPEWVPQVGDTVRVVKVPHGLDEADEVNAALVGCEGVIVEEDLRKGQERLAYKVDGATETYWYATTDLELIARRES